MVSTTFSIKVHGDCFDPSASSQLKQNLPYWDSALGMHNPEKPLHTPLLLGYTAPCFRQTGGVSFRVGGLTLSRSPAASNKKLPCVMCLWPWDKQTVSTRHKTLQSWFPRKSLLWVTKKSLHTVLIYLKMSKIYSLDFSIKYQVRLCFQHGENQRKLPKQFQSTSQLGICI